MEHATFSGSHISSMICIMSGNLQRIGHKTGAKMLQAKPSPRGSSAYRSPHGAGTQGTRWHREAKLETIPARGGGRAAPGRLRAQAHAAPAVPGCPGRQQHGNDALSGRGTRRLGTSGPLAASSSSCPAPGAPVGGGAGGGAEQCSQPRPVQRPTGTAGTTSPSPHPTASRRPEEAGAAGASPAPRPPSRGRYKPLFPTAVAELQPPGPSCRSPWAPPSGLPGPGRAFFRGGSRPQPALILGGAALPVGAGRHPPPGDGATLRQRLRPSASSVPHAGLFPSAVGEAGPGPAASGERCKMAPGAPHPVAMATPKAARPGGTRRCFTAALCGSRWWRRGRRARGRHGGRRELQGHRARRPVRRRRARLLARRPGRGAA